MEVLCENTLFRVHSHNLRTCSPVLANILSPMDLVRIESRNPCPCIVLPTTAADFAVFLKFAYPLVFVALPACR